MALDIRTSYGPDSVTTSGSGGGGGGDTSGLKALLEQLARRNLQSNLRGNLQGKGKPRRGGDAGAALGRGAPARARLIPRQTERAAPRPQSMDEGRIPMYTKTIGGAGMIGGTVQAQPWERGAAFAGYAPKGYNPYPSSAQMISGPGESPASLSASAIPDRGGIDPEGSDPFPHGTGAAFEAERFRAARARSDQEAERRQALEQALAGMRR